MSNSDTIGIKLKVWRQKNASEQGHFETYDLPKVRKDSSFLEMLDELNETLVMKNQEPIVFDHDCREGICGSCGIAIDGEPHGPVQGITTCQLHMRSFADGQTLTLEPFRAGAFPIIRDLMVDRSAFDRIISAGGYISVNTGSAPEANATPIPKIDADEAFHSATCIGCGACVAACKNGSASLFTSAKVTHLSLLPQGQVEAGDRVVKMIAQMDSEGFGSCTNTGACSATCPKEISLTNIVNMNRQYLAAQFKS